MNTLPQQAAPAQGHGTTSSGAAGVGNKPALEHDTMLRARLFSSFEPMTGVPISIRPLFAADFAIHEQFARSLSAKTRYDRLLGGACRFTPEALARLTRVDYPRELALAAVLMLDGQETLIGVARYAFDKDSRDYEFALVVADAWQRHGLGRRLLQSLIAAARAHGVNVLMSYRCRSGTRSTAKRHRRDRRPGTSTVQRDPRPLSEGGRRSAGGLA